MKIVLATFGSRGDVQPMPALSTALKSSGHDVLLVGPPEMENWASELKIPYTALGCDVTALIDSVDKVYTLKSALTFIRQVRHEIANQFSRLPGIVEGAHAVIGASLCAGLSSVAEAMGIPYRYIAFTPQLLPSAPPGSP